MKHPMLVLATTLLLSACSPSSSEGKPETPSAGAESPSETTQAQEESTEKSEIEAQREELLAKWGAAGLPQPLQIDEAAQELLALPLEEQSVEALTELAEEANRAANFVNFIFEEYAEYHRDNYRYDFVQEKVAPFHDAYVDLSNRLKGRRNQAFFNLGLKHKAQGNQMAAFFFFRDAFRLSSFTEDGGDHKGLRYQAEVEMKQLLGIDHLGSFVYWQ